MPGDQPQQLDKQALDSAFTDLYKAHLRDVYSFLYYRLGNHHDAEDVSEQVFLQAYRHLGKALAESDGRSLRPWLIRIAQNLAINLYRDRSRKPQAPLEAAGEFADTHDVEQLVAAREELSQVFAQVADLPDDRREALIMRFALGMDNHEIAVALGKSEGATKVLLHRAIKQLGEKLESTQEQLSEPSARSS
ncbi:MAG: RNA polymerase sigma factor [Actinobacteria bacterium]|nr:RNA polymerase sigma factor [Actinomycetota bacterium]